MRIPTENYFNSKKNKNLKTQYIFHKYVRKIMSEGKKMKIYMKMNIDR